MRILHTADWHLGARLGLHDRWCDHKAALESLKAAACERRPDLIVHAGDVFDSFNPGHEVLHRALDALDALSEIAPMVVIGGNHDSYALLRAVETLTRKAMRERLALVTRPQAVKMRTEKAGTAWVACVPFLTAGIVLAGRTVDPEDRRQAYAAGVAAISGQVWAEVDEMAKCADAQVYAAHLYVYGSRPGRSERRVTVSDDYATEGGGIPKNAEYACFGHIHDAQPIPGRAHDARYAGALIPLDFGEAEQNKSADLIELGGGDPLVETLPAATGRPFCNFEGELAELLTAASAGGLDGRFVRAIVHSDDRIYDLSRQVSEAAPEAVIHELTNLVRNQEARAVTDYDYRPVAEPPLEEMFVEWRRTRTKDERENDEVGGVLFAQAMKNAEMPGTHDYGVDRIGDDAEKAIAQLNANAGAPR